MALLVAPLALALVLSPASPRFAVRHSARVCTPRCTEEPQRTYRVTVPGKSAELYAFRQKPVEDDGFKYNKKTHWLIDVPSWSPVAPSKHFEFDHSLHLRGFFTIFMCVIINRIVLIMRFGPSMGLNKGDEFKAGSVEEEAELHEFVCEDCGFTLFPARGREGKFFSDRCGFGVEPALKPALGGGAGGC